MKNKTSMYIKPMSYSMYGLTDMSLGQQYIDWYKETTNRKFGNN